MKMACGENPKTFDAEKGRGPTSRQGEVAYIRHAFAEARDYRDALAALPRRSGEGTARRRTIQNSTPWPRCWTATIAVHMHCYRADEMAVMLDLSHELGFRIAAFHHAVEGYKIAPLLAEGRRLRGGLVGLVGLQDGGARRHPRERRLPRRRRRLRDHALGLAASSASG